MAGTRLLIHLWCLVQLVAMLGIGAYFGLCLNQSDHICRPFLTQQGRRWLGSSKAGKLLGNATKSMSGIDSSIFAATIAVDETKLAEWENFSSCTDQCDANSAPTSQLSSLARVRSVSSDHLLSVCASGRRGVSSLYAHSADIWICNGYNRSTGVDSSSSHSQDQSSLLSDIPKIVIVNTTMILYFQTQYAPDEGFDFVRSLLPIVDDETPVGMRSEQLAFDVTLWIDDETTDWRTWMEYLTETIRHSEPDRLPCLMPFTQHPPNVNIAFGNATNIGKSLDHDHGGAQDEQHIDARKYLQEIGVHPTLRPADTKEVQSLSVHMIVPGASTSSLWFTSLDGEASGTSLLIQLNNNEWVVRVDPFASATSAPRSSIDIAWARLIDQVARQCLSIPSSLPSKIETTDGSIPSLYSKLWYHRAFLYRRELLLNLAQMELRWIQNLPSTISVPFDTVSSWKSALELMTNSWTGSSQQEAIARLDLARRRLLLLGRHPELMEPVDDFPLDQQAAVLAPLVIPLLLPLLLGLVREVRRYRELCGKTRDATTKGAKQNSDPTTR